MKILLLTIVPNRHWENLTLGVFKVFSTLLGTLEALEIKPIGYHLKILVWVGIIAGAQGTRVQRSRKI